MNKQKTKKEPWWKESDISNWFERSLTKDELVSNMSKLNVAAARSTLHALAHTAMIAAITDKGSEDLKDINAEESLDNMIDNTLNLYLKIMLYQNGINSTKELFKKIILEQPFGILLAGTIDAIQLKNLKGYSQDVAQLMHNLGIKSDSTPSDVNELLEGLYSLFVSKLTSGEIDQDRQNKVVSNAQKQLTNDVKEAWQEYINTKHLDNEIEKALENQN